MLYPSLQELTNDKINRYALVMGTAKCARHITDLINRKKEMDAANATKDLRGESQEEEMYEKAVSIAIKRISEHKYKLNMTE